MDYFRDILSFSLFFLYIFLLPFFFAHLPLIGDDTRVKNILNKNCVHQSATLRMTNFVTRTPFNGVSGYEPYGTYLKKGKKEKLNKKKKGKKN